MLEYKVKFLQSIFLLFNIFYSLSMLLHAAATVFKNFSIHCSAAAGYRPAQGQALQQEKSFTLLLPVCIGTVQYTPAARRQLTSSAGQGFCFFLPADMACITMQRDTAQRCQKIQCRIQRLEAMRGRCGQLLVATRQPAEVEAYTGQFPLGFHLQYFGQVLMASQDEARSVCQTVRFQSCPGGCQGFLLYVHAQQEGIFRRVLQQEEAVVTIAASCVYKQERRSLLQGKSHRCYGPVQGRMGQMIQQAGMACRLQGSPTVQCCCLLQRQKQTWPACLPVQLHQGFPATA